MLNQREILEKLRDYCQESLDGIHGSESCPDFLSALVNTVDSARTGDIPCGYGPQFQRELAFANFVLLHKNAEPPKDQAKCVACDGTGRVKIEEWDNGGVPVTRYRIKLPESCEVNYDEGSGEIIVDS